PVPQLVQRIVYDVDAPSLDDGGKTVPLFAVDSFPEQLHKPITDHGDFINVLDEDLMNEVVACINQARTCGAGGDGGNGGDNGGGDDGNGNGGNNGGDKPEQPTAEPEDPNQGGDQNNGGDQGKGDDGKQNDGKQDDGKQGGDKGDGGQEPS